MARDLISLNIPDLSSFAKARRSDMMRREEFPSHAAFLSAIAKAAGFDNHQHLKAAKPSASPKNPQLRKALAAFDAQGIMSRWPSQTSVQGLCLWVFWAQLPAERPLNEPQVNAILKAGNSFGDHVLLRRSLIDHRLVRRAIDGSSYTRIEQAPPEAALALMAEIRGRTA